VRTLRVVSFLLIVTLLVFSLSGCGWRLRGSQEVDVALPSMQLHFQQASADLKRELTQSLQSAGVDLNSNAERVLTIHTENQGRRVLAVDSSGKVSDYELQYELLFSLQEGKQVLISNERIRQQRDYQFDENAVLAKGEEEQRLFDFMRRMSIQSLMRRLHAVTTANTEPASDAN